MAERLARLREAYRPRLCAALDALYRSLDDATPLDVDALRVIHERTHKLRGTCGSYGFRDTSMLLLELELSIDRAIAGAPGSRQLWRELVTRSRLCASAPQLADE
jgi:hypothetical protein